MLPKSRLIFALGFLTSCFADPQFRSVGPARRDVLQDTIGKVLDAMGGKDALISIKGAKYSAPQIYRTQTLTQSYHLQHSDEFSAIRGFQDISFSFNTSGKIQQRIDRSYWLGDYWVFAQPALADPVSFSVVVHDGDGDDSFVWFKNGTNSIPGGPNSTTGYADPDLTQFLITDAHKTSPLLMLEMANLSQTAYAEVEINGLKLPAIEDGTRNFTIILDPQTYLPHIVRQQEYNDVFGESTRDLYLTQYTAVTVPGGSSNKSVMLAHRHQVVYNNEAELEDTEFDSITLNPTFDDGFFQDFPNPLADHPNKTSAAQGPRHDQAEVGEFWGAGLWNGEFVQSYDTVNVTHPIPSLPQISFLTFTIGGDPETTSGYGQLVVEFSNSVLVADAPKHLAPLVLKWVEENTAGKKVTHLWPSHHHHDHVYGASEYVKAGAKMVVPTGADKYWQNIPSVKFEVFDEKSPFVMSDDKVQVRAMWRPGAVHAEDWSYLVATSACPSAGNASSGGYEMVLFEADVWQTSTSGFFTGAGHAFDMGFARQWLNWLVEDGVSNGTMVASSHGGVEVLQDLIEITGFVYPQFGVGDWKAGGELCRAGPQGN